MHKLKICFVIDTWFPIVGGGPQVCWYYAKYLAQKHNCQVDIITRRFNQQDNYYLEKIRNVRIIRVGPSLSWKNIFSRLLFVIFTLKHLFSNDYDIIHAFPFIAGIPVYLYGLFKKKPVVFSAFALASQSKTNRFHILNLIEDFLTLYLPYDLLITDNQEFIKHHSKKRKIFYLNNGVEINLFEKVKTKKDKFPRILFVGRFHPQKGIPNLLKSVPHLLKEFPNFKLIMIGYGSEEKMIKKFIYEKKLDRFIEVKQPKYGLELVKEYKKSHLLVLPSLYEGGAIVILEAWAAKIPVIATKVGSLPTLVKDGINGYLTLPADIFDLTNKIRLALRDQKLLARMGINGYIFVKRFSWEVIVKNLYKEYLKLL